MAKIDMKDAYFMVPMAKEDRHFLKFHWEDKFYQFNCLPFGLSSAPWVFTKTTRPVVATLQELGLRLIIYIYDILVMAETETLLTDHITAVIYLLENLGFVINHSKSELTPTQEIEFLGFTVNSTRGEDQEDQNRGRQGPAITLGIGSDPVPPDWENECCHTGHSHGTTVLQEPPSLPPRGERLYRKNRATPQ